MASGVNTHTHTHTHILWWNESDFKKPGCGRRAPGLKKYITYITTTKVAYSRIRHLNNYTTHFSENYIFLTTCYNHEAKSLNSQ